MKTVDEFTMLDNVLWERYGAEYGFQLDKCWEAYREGVSSAVKEKVPKSIWLELERLNHYSLVQALRELRLLGE